MLGKIKLTDSQEDTGGHVTSSSQRDDPYTAHRKPLPVFSMEFSSPCLSQPDLWAVGWALAAILVYEDQGLSLGE